MSQEFEFIPEYKSYTEGHLASRFTPDVKIYEQGRVDGLQKLAISSILSTLIFGDSIFAISSNLS